MGLTAWKKAPVELRLLMGASALMVIGFYSTIPRLTLHLTQNYHWSLALAGLVLAVRQLTQQGLGVFGGAIVDRIGAKSAIVSGLILRGSGFFGFALAQTLPQFLAAAVLSGLGGCLFDPGDKKAFAEGTNRSNQELLFSLRKVTDNGAFALAALVGIWVVDLEFSHLSLFSGSIYILVAALVWRALPEAKQNKPAIRPVAWRSVFADRPFLLYTTVLCGYYYLACQLYGTVPALLNLATGTESSLYLLYLGLAVAIVALQIPLSMRLRRWRNRPQLIGAGALLMAGGLAYLSLRLPHSPVAFAVLFGLGLMVSAPVLPEIIPTFASQEVLGTYYGFNNYAIAVGGSLSSTLAGFLIDRSPLVATPITNLLVGLCVLTALSCLPTRQRPSPLELTAAFTPR